MREQLQQLGLTFDWEREVSTCSPGYYRHTQQLFLDLHRAGLAYRQEAMVNWDPVDCTVLADEQVDNNGRSWRSGALVERKPLSQWFFRTTALARGLQEGLTDPSLVNWRAVTAAQRNWIGDCSGTSVECALLAGGQVTGRSLTTWTARLEAAESARFVLVHPEHLVAQLYPGQQLAVTHPLTRTVMPVVVTDQAEFPRGCQALLGLPGLEPGHRDLADTAGLEVEDSVECGESREAVLGRLAGCGPGSGHLTSSNLRDWLISRQRYWGTPIPIIHCPTCGPVPVPSSQLPVCLPELAGEAVAGRGMSPLLQCKDWLEVECPDCGNTSARRETDTMDTFVDSSWYYLRYLDPHNSEAGCGPAAAKDMPVDLYIGGMEHAYLHLYFARFVSHFLHSAGQSPAREPFRGLLTQGMVRGRSFRLKSSTRYLGPHQVEEQQPGRWVERDTGKPVVAQFEKMSKSKYNGVDPGELVAKYGCDTVRLLMLSSVGPGTERDWSEEGYPGVRNMQIKLWKLVHQAVSLQQCELPELRSDTELLEYRELLRRERNTHLRHINYNYSHTRNLAVVLARLNSLINAVWSVPGQVKRDAPEYQRVLGEILTTLAPIAPHMSAELWESFRSLPARHWAEFRWEEGVFQQQWPECDPTAHMELKVMGNRSELARIPVVKWHFDTLTQEQAFDLACHDNKVQTRALPFDIEQQTFSKIEGFEAVLELTYMVPEEVKIKLSADEKAELKLAKQREKLAKKAARDERLKIYHENVARKEKIVKSNPKYPKRSKIE